MDNITFRQHLHQATTFLVEFTGQLCYNELADTYRYLITPSVRTVAPDDNHLTDKEIQNLALWNTYENQLLPAERVVALLHHDNTVPVWINITVYESKPTETIIDLLCSRRLRSESELYHQGAIAPFHVQVAMPPDHLKIEKNGKFDVNWKKSLDVRSKL